MFSLQASSPGVPRGTEIWISVSNNNSNQFISTTVERQLKEYARNKIINKHDVLAVIILHINLRSVVQVIISPDLWCNGMTLLLVRCIFWIKLLILWGFQDPTTPLCRMLFLPLVFFQSAQLMWLNQMICIIFFECLVTSHRKMRKSIIIFSQLNHVCN